MLAVSPLALQTRPPTEPRAEELPPPEERFDSHLERADIGSERAERRRQARSTADEARAAGTQEPAHTDAAHDRSGQEIERTEPAERARTDVAASEGAAGTDGASSSMEAGTDTPATTDEAGAATPTAELVPANAAQSAGPPTEEIAPATGAATLMADTLAAPYALPLPAAPGTAALSAVSEARPAPAAVAGAAKGQTKSAAAGHGQHPSAGGQTIPAQAGTHQAVSTPGAQAPLPQGPAADATTTDAAARLTAQSAPTADGAPREAGPQGQPAAPGQAGTPVSEARTPPPVRLHPHAAHNAEAMRVLGAQIARNASNGLTRFEIRLDPPELGRIDVKLEFGPEGRLTARLIVDRAETLDLLQRDARFLERTLTDSGLKADTGSLSFALRDDARQNPLAQERGGDGGRRLRGLDAVPDADALPAESVSAAAVLARGGVDLRI
ncbi:MAG: flagellar hook-length control protein FliK [Alphaproteobacteria bacterium]|nr:flagellar hook-length control protein FliK [Alphaproteobacteria bacterium]